LSAQNPGCPNIARIKAVGNQRISTDSILSFIRSEANKPCDEETADEDILAPYQIGNFETVELEFEGTNNSSCISVFDVKERPQIKHSRLQIQTQYPTGGTSSAWRDGQVTQCL
jgi:outer membrane protein assembly factor BamA